MGGVLVKNNDKPPEESILLNQPLDGSDQGKLLIFSLLMAAINHGGTFYKKS